MIRRIWNAYRVERSKALRRKFSYVGPVLVVLVVVIVCMVKKFTGEKESGYAFIAFATPMALNLLGLILLLMFSATLVSSEVGNGSIRMALMRPLRRAELIAAKVLLTMSYSVLLTFCVAATCWLLAPILGGLEGITYGDETLYSSADMALAYLYGVLLVLLPQFAAGAYAVMISSFTRSTGAAVSSVVGLWILTDIVKYPLNVDRFLFSTYLETPWRVFVDRCNGLDPVWFPNAWYCIISSVGYFVLFVVAAAVALSRKDIRL